MLRILNCLLPPLKPPTHASDGKVTPKTLGVRREGITLLEHSTDDKRLSDGTLIGFWLFRVVRVFILPSLRSHAAKVADLFTCGIPTSIVMCNHIHVSNT